jgi:hypothetical protein
MLLTNREWMDEHEGLYLKEVGSGFQIKKQFWHMLGQSLCYKSGKTKFVNCGTYFPQVISE